MADHLNINGNQSCLSEGEMIDYIADKLSKEKHRHVELHILHCELCSDAIEGLSLLKNPEELKIISSQLGRKIDVVTKKNEGYFIRISIAAASLLLISLSILFFIYNKKDNEMLAIQNQDIISTDTPKEKIIRLPDVVSSDAAISNNEAEVLPNQSPSKIASSQSTEEKERNPGLSETSLQEYNSVAAESSSGSQIAKAEEEITEKDVQPVAAPAPSSEVTQQIAFDDLKISDHAKKGARSESRSVQDVDESSIEDKELSKIEKEEIAEAEVKFINKEYLKAARLFENFLKFNPHNEISIQHCGICYINLKEYDKAISKFNKIGKHSIYFEEAQYYLAVAYAKTEKKFKAKTILEDLIKGNGAFKNKAIELKSTIP